jgi:hypothetical protein
MQLLIVHDVTDDDVNGPQPPQNGFWAAVSQDAGRTLWRKISLIDEITRAQRCPAQRDHREAATGEDTTGDRNGYEKARWRTIGAAEAVEAINRTNGTGASSGIDEQSCFFEERSCANGNTGLTKFFTRRRTALTSCRKTSKVLRLKGNQGRRYPASLFLKVLPCIIQQTAQCLRSLVRGRKLNWQPPC